MPVDNPEVGKFYRYLGKHLAYVSDLDAGGIYSSNRGYVKGIIFTDPLEFGHGDYARRGAALRTARMEELDD